MKFTPFAVVIALAALPAAAQTAKHGRTKESTAAATQAARPASSAPAAPASQPPALALPADAREIEPNTWRHTDAKGSKWIYRRTPFGLVRFEEGGAAPPPSSESAALAAVEDGDNIRFEQPGPFGTYRWVRKKSELTEPERQAWERGRAAAKRAANE